MPMNFTMTIKGERQGDMHTGASSADSIGNLARTDREDEMTCVQFASEIEIPRDPSSGMPQGRRRHNGVVVTKLLDKSSPLLAQALATGEGLTDVEMKFYRINFNGEEEHYYTIALKDARIVKIEFDIKSSIDNATAGFPGMEVVTLTYREITWEQVVAGTSGNDNFESGNRA